MSKAAAIVLLLWIAIPHAGAATLVRPDDLPRWVRERNAHAQAASSREAAAAAETGFLARAYLPRLEAMAGVEAFRSSGLGRDTQPFGRIEARVNLFRGGRDWIEGQKRAAHARAAALSSSQTYLEELAKTRQAYWEANYHQDLDLLLQEALQQNEKHQAAARQRIQAGIATQADTLEFQMNRVQLDQDATRAKIRRQNAEASLRALLGLEAGEEIELPDRIPHVHEDPLLARTLQLAEHRGLRLLDEQLEEVRLESRQASHWWGPALDVYGSYSLYTVQEREYARAADRTEAAFGVRLSLPLFDGLDGLTARRTAALRSTALEQERDQTSRELATSFESAKNELQLIHSLLESAEEGARLGDDYLAQTLQEYRRGVKNSPDVLGATQKNLELKRRAIELKRDYQMARAELLRLLGE